MKYSKRKMIPVFSTVGGIVVFIAAGIGIRKFPLYSNRRVLIQYMKEHHPNYHIAKEEVKYDYTTGGGFFPLPETIKPCANITFDEEGFDYVVSAFDGVVTNDNYAIKKLSYEIGKFAKEGFTEVRGIENVEFSCSSLDLDNGNYNVTIAVCGQGKTPRGIGWLWDFRDNQHFNHNWKLNFEIYRDLESDYYPDSTISIHSTEKFDSKEEWYANNTYPPKYR